MKTGTLRSFAQTAQIVVCSAMLQTLAQAGNETVAEPAVLIVNGARETPSLRPDYDWMARLHRRKLHLDVHYYGSEPLSWSVATNYNVLLILDLPMRGEGAESDICTATQDVLERYVDAGGGLFFMPYVSAHSTSQAYGGRKWTRYLDAWGVRYAHDWILDEASVTAHPKHGRTFIYTDRIAASPVSAGVNGIWFPNDFHGRGARYGTSHGFPVWPLDEQWQVVVRGRKGSFVEAIPPTAGRLAHFTPEQRRIWQQERFFSPDPALPPALFAIRDTGRGRLAVTVMNPIYHIRSGASWIHDGVVLDKGLNGVPSDFDLLFLNTVRWMAEPSLSAASPGGYVQDPDVIVHPHFRKPPETFFPQFDAAQNPTPPAHVYRGVIGARSAYSSGAGTVAEWAAAARRAELDFVVFLEEFAALSEAKLEQLEAECRELSSEDLALIPGFSIRNNVGNHEWYQGFGHQWPPASGIDDENRLVMQNFDEHGELTGSAKLPARGWRWGYTDTRGTRNIGYHNFAGSAPGHVPVRNLRLYGMLGVVTYIGGELVEDITDSYWKLLPQSNPPRICAVSILNSPEELEAFVRKAPYLTHVAARSVQEIPHRMRYGHQYGRDNVNLSSGPRIHSWAGTRRVMTYAGEPFVTDRYRVPVLAKVSSDAGLEEIRIYRDAGGRGARLFRRIKLNGEHSYEHLFEWGYDRQSLFVLEVIDANGGRALSAAFEMWHDGNYHQWCHDRHNGELWHGPFMIGGTWETGVRNPYSVGTTWDGGGSLTRFMGLNLRIDNPNLVERDAQGARVGDPRRMEGHTYIACIDDTVRNLAGEAWNVYAPGRVANSYETWGPIRPSERMRFRVRRTEYLSRIEGPHRDWHAMWAERDGGGLALHEGAVELLKEMTVDGLERVGRLSFVSFFGDNEPVFVIRESAAAQAPGMFRVSDLPAGITLEPGGYFGVFGSLVGSPSMVCNLSDRPVTVRRRGREWSYHPGWFHAVDLADLDGRILAEGDELKWRLMYVYDSLDHDARSVERMETVWRYFGMDGGSGTHGLEVKRGVQLASAGLVDLRADPDGVVAFTVPEPDLEPALDIPLGIRFFGFNPNWTVGLHQAEGYSPGFYHDGKDLYRNLGLDDKGIAHLAVYTRDVALTQIAAGHPVVADAQELIVEVVKLSDAPHRWQVAVNNPTDAPLSSGLRPAMDLPGFDFPPMQVTLPAGRYEVVWRTDDWPLPTQNRR